MHDVNKNIIVSISWDGIIVFSNADDLIVIKRVIYWKIRSRFPSKAKPKTSSSTFVTLQNNNLGASMEYAGPFELHYTVPKELRERLPTTVMHRCQVGFARFAQLDRDELHIRKLRETIIFILEPAVNSDVEVRIDESIEAIKMDSKSSFISFAQLLLVR